MDVNTIRIGVMLLMMVGFLGVCAWAWSRKRRTTFDEASRLPLEEDHGEIPHTTDANSNRTGEE